MRYDCSLRTQSAVMSSFAAGPPPGWYPDPTGRFAERRWDGREWAQAARTGDLAELVDNSFVPASLCDALPARQSQGGPAVAGAQGSLALAAMAGVRTSLAPAAPAARASRYTSLSFEAAGRHLAQALETFGQVTIDGVTATRIDGRVRVRGRINWLIAGVLLLFYVIPCIVYVVWAQREKDDKFHFTLAPENKGTRITLNGSAEANTLLTSIVLSLPA